MAMTAGFLFSHEAGPGALEILQSEAYSMHRSEDKVRNLVRNL